MKKALSFVLILVLALSLCVPVFADNTGTGGEATAPTTSTPGTITITNALKGETYNLYKLFDFTWDGDKAYSYTLPVDSSWETFFTTGAGSTYFTIDSTTRAVTPTDKLGTGKSDPSVRAFADAAMAYLADTTNNIKADDSITAEADGSITFSGLTYGYYLIDTTMGTVCVLDSNSTDLTVTDKTSAPTQNKQVREDDGEGDGWSETYANAPIGQDVDFRAIINNVYKREDLVYHDAMSTGLTLNKETVAVYMRPDKNEKETYLTPYDPNSPNDPYDYKVIYPDQTVPAHADGKKCTFEIIFEDTYLQGLASNSAYLVVTYSAELNEQAEITTPGGQDLTQGGNPNDSAISYGQSQWSTWDQVTVHTWPLEVFKYTTVGGVKTSLAGAKFVLAKPLVAGGKAQWAYVKAVDADNVPLTGVTYDQNNNPTPNGWILSDVNETTKVAPIPEGVYEFSSTNADGTPKLITINGLDAHDEYVLIETEAPEGYNKLSAPLYFRINDSAADGVVGYVEINNISGLNSQLEVENRTGTELPSTGGVGTTMFYIVGGVLAVGAVVLLVTKKRMGSEG